MSARSSSQPQQSTPASRPEPSTHSEPAEPEEQQAQELNEGLEEELFGGEEDDEDDEDDDGSLQSAGDITQEPERNPLEYDEDHDPPVPPRNLHIAEATIPNLPFPRPSDGKHWDLRIPNFLSLNPLPFSDDAFLNDENETSDKEGVENESSRLFSSQNVIRWRWQKDSNGKPIKQSNTRVICWDDGSQSLQVGSELFDMVSTVDGQPGASMKNGGPARGTTQGLTYLFAQYSELKLLEAQASITGQINLRPHTLNSVTHRTIVANRTALKAHSQRQTQKRVITADPEKEKIDKELEEERKLKELKKLESKLARQTSRQAYLAEHGRGPPPDGVRKRRFHARLLSDEAELDEEEEDDYEDEMDDDDQEPNPARSHSLARQQEPELTELELADQRLEEHERIRKRKPERPSSVPKAEPTAPPEPKVTKRKLIIASDDDD